MPRFEYIAVDASGQRITGQAEGADVAAVDTELRRGGWTLLSIHLLQGALQALSHVEGAIVAQHLVAATRAGLPISGALRALSEEATSSSLKRNLTLVCEAVERGEPLDQILKRSTLRLPPLMSAILGSGLPANAISGMLIHIMQSAAALRELRARVLVLMSYPLCIFMAMFGLWVFLLVYITPVYGEVSASLQLTTTPLHKLLTKLASLMPHFTGWWLFGGLVGVGVCIAGIFRAIPAGTRNRLWFSIPFIGRMYRLMALSDFAQVLAIMLECHVPLPKALIWVADGSPDEELSKICGAVSHHLQSGDSMDVIIATEVGLPVYAEQILRWAALGEEGSEPLKGLAQMLRLRGRLLAESTMPLMEPIMLIGAVIAIILYATSALPPLFQLFNLLM